MYAVLSSGGKQYRVEPGTTLLVERVAGDPGASITFDRVLLVADGDDVMVGTPTVAGASITGTILREELGPKIVVFKFKQKIKYRRRTGHRQHLARIRIDEITANGKSVKAEAAAPEKAEGKPRRARAKPKAETKADEAEAVESEKAEPAPKTRAKPKSKSTTAETKSTKAGTKVPKPKAKAPKPKAKAAKPKAKAGEKAEKPKARARAKPRSKPKADKE
jgi:large subunit ribosomal protein L21